MAEYRPMGALDERGFVLATHQCPWCLATLLVRNAWPGDGALAMTCLGHDVTWAFTWVTPEEPRKTGIRQIPPGEERA